MKLKEKAHLAYNHWKCGWSECENAVIALPLRGKIHSEHKIFVFDKEVLQHLNKKPWD